MSYCIAFSVDGATDVTRRYVRSTVHALLRPRCSEDTLKEIIDDIRRMRRAELSGDHQLRLDCEDFREDEELQVYINMERGEDDVLIPEVGTLKQRKRSDIQAKNLEDISFETEQDVSKDLNSML